MNIRRRIARVRRQARLALLGQALWSAFWPGQIVLGLFLLLALSDLLPRLDGWTHSAVLGALAAVLGWTVWRAWRRFRRPLPEAADRQVERASGLRHRPLTSLEDRPATAGPEAQLLWGEHLARIAARIRRLRAGWPPGIMPARDPWALRILTLVCLAVAFGLAGQNAGERMGRALAPSFAVAQPVPVTVDVWIEPPAYTGRPTLFAGAGETAFELPEGSTVHARVSGVSGGAVLAAGPDRKPLQGSGAVVEGSTPIRTGGRISVFAEDRELVGWPVSVVPDFPPSARFDMPPRATSRHAFRINYGGSDDYGVTAMRAEAAPVDDSAAEPLVLPLPVLGEPQAPRGDAYFDLTAHIWAGREVSLRILARDGAGQEGEGPSLLFVLPERPFTHPVARALVEERKTLHWDGRQATAERLDGIAAGSDLYDGDPAVTLALAVAAARLRGARQAEPALPSVRSLLWKTALRLEDGGLALADRELRAAQDAIMRALERGAEAEEIDRLFDSLSRAIDRLLQELAARAGETGDEAGPAPGEAGQDQLFDREGLQQMVERIRRLWEAGAREEARELLAQLQNILENVRLARMGEGQAERQAGMMQKLKELRELSRDQQRLLDRTFRRGRPPPTGQLGQGQQSQGQQSQGQQGQRQGADSGYPDLQQAQEGLRRRLGDYMRRLGADMGRVPRELGRASGSMRDASGSLRTGRHGEAVEAQGRALRELQKAGDRMLQEFAREGSGQGGIADGQSNFDPLGRRDGGFLPDGSDVVLPEEGNFQRARHIRDELRRRVGDEMRPAPERDYIERLLRRF
ncbi:MAG: TIGR02302 family protein [Alphaproteobacteria bacterium]|nr:TIGR02302 family protein [Alphaproteobacteria bacterium]